MTGATDDRLRLLCERIERLTEEKRGIAGEILDVYAEAKSVGYDPKLLRQLIKRRAMKPDDRLEADAVLETYECAVGLSGQPHAVSAPARSAAKQSKLARLRADAADARKALGDE